MSGDFAGHLPSLLIWGLVATVAMTTILQASQGLGLSRLNLPFLVGTLFTRNRNAAVIVGFIAYTIGGWLFALLYFVFFASIGVATWWLGAILGFLHGIFLLVCALPLLPYAHPRMASEHDGPGHEYILEPPGFLGLNYGRRTPITTLLAQTVYGLMLGAFEQASGFIS
ncbi:MAG: hypothetical protein ACRETY_11640 [Steroidobacteraceae bacterium]